jgi:hypothetical protein
MQLATTMPAAIVHQDTSLLRRFAAKVMIDVMPAALVSVLGGLLMTQYQVSHLAALRLASAQVTPASAEMVQLVRDEHAAIMDYLKAKRAAEKSRNDAEDAASARAAVDAKAPPVAQPAVMSPAAPVRSASPIVVAAKAAPPHSKVDAAALLPHAPLVIANAEPSVAGAAPVIAPESKSLLARSLDLKDHVVHATLHAVSTIGGIPSWIASLGDRTASGSANSEGRSFATAS